MLTSSLNNRYPSDGRIIRRHVEAKDSSILVIERANPGHLMNPMKFVDEDSDGMNNRNRILCSTFGNKLETAEYNLEDIEIYRSE